MVAQDIQVETMTNEAKSASSEPKLIFERMLEKLQEQNHGFTAEQLTPSLKLCRPIWDANRFAACIKALKGSAVEYQRKAGFQIVKFDLEQRWSKKEGKLLEVYLKNIRIFHPDQIAKLMLAEFVSRQQFGPPPTLDDFQKRFPKQFPQFSKLLSDLEKSKLAGDTLISSASSPAIESPAPATTNPVDQASGSGLRRATPKILMPLAIVFAVLFMLALWVILF